MVDRAFLCLLRNVSSTGFAIRLPGEINIDRKCVLQLSNDRTYESRLMWQRAEAAGFEFDRPVEVDELIAPPHEFDARPIRLQVNRRAWAWIGGRSSTVDLLDISVGGAKLRGGEGLRFGDILKLNLEGLGSLEASVRWRIEDVTGVMFSTPLKFAQLAQWSML